MSEPTAVGGTEVPTFIECVLGYRAWKIDDEDRLWPISDRRAPWEPGINTARCNCVVRGALSFDWSLRDGRRVLETHPEHEAPSADCTCGLYSWRRPRPAWKHGHRFASGTVVCGAVASWGRLQVHGEGFRAEHACVVTLAYPPGVDARAMQKLERVAARYGVELVALDRLEEVASRHGSPLPDSLQPETESKPAAPRARPTPAEPRQDAQRDGAANGSRAAASLSFKPLPVRDRVGLTLLFFGVSVGGCGWYMFLGRGDTARIGGGLAAVGCVVVILAEWWLQPHRAARHAGYRLRHHARNASQWRRQAPSQWARPALTDAEFEAIEDELEPLYKHGTSLYNHLGSHSR